MQNNDLQFHLKARAGDVGRYCLLPGDPARCTKIAQYFDVSLDYLTGLTNDKRKYW